jgi:hypothetical protein
MEVIVSEMARQVSAVLTSAVANTVALEDLKAIFTKFLANNNCSGDGSGSVSISALETQGGTGAPDQEIFSVSASGGE